MRILVLNGPNLNLLGERDPKHYGSDTLDKIYRRIEHECDLNGWDVDFFQTSGEGEIVDRLHLARLEFDGVILNAGAYSHYSYAIRDAIDAITVPVVEVHLSNIYAREEFRRTSVISPVCAGSISGFGSYGYMLALSALANIVEG